MCVTKEEFVQRHAAVEEDGNINPLVKNQIISFKFLEKVKLACTGKGLEGKFYRIVAQVLPLGMKLYGKYNEIGIIPVTGAFEFVEPTLYDL